MAGYLCPSCEAHSPEAGRCVVCGKHLGNWCKAWLAALISTLGLTLLWIVVSALTRMQLPIMALLFGGTISFCVSHFSGGRGVFFQVLATACTFAGILFADTLAMAVIAHLDLRHFDQADLLVHLEFRLKDDPVTGFFYVLGVMGGFYIWR